jgi:hypothetical protein
LGLLALSDGAIPHFRGLFLLAGLTSEISRTSLLKSGSGGMVPRRINDSFMYWMVITTHSGV